MNEDRHIKFATMIMSKHCELFWISRVGHRAGKDFCQEQNLASVLNITGIPCCQLYIGMTPSEIDKQQTKLSRKSAAARKCISIF